MIRIRGANAQNKGYCLVVLATVGSTCADSSGPSTWPLFPDPARTTLVAPVQACAQAILVPAQMWPG